MSDSIRKLIKPIWKDVMGVFPSSIPYFRSERYRNEGKENICRADTSVFIG